MKNSISSELDKLHLSDVYSLMLFALYKVQDIPDYATLSELCYLLDGSNLNRLFTYFAGQTITFPTKEEMSTMSNALLLYQYVDIEGQYYVDAMEKLRLTPAANKRVAELYLQIVDILKNYNFSRAEVNKNDRR